jgi:GNAT superfamily N-acetyltransferase
MSEFASSSDSRAASADVADERRRGGRGSVRPIRPDDVPAAVALVREKALHEVLLTEQQLTERLFGDAPALFGHVAEVDGEVVGIALWFLNFSTWRGTHGIYLEDLYVQHQHRGSGLGKELLRTLAAVCVERGYSRLEWAVLDWNTPSIDFYKAAGAVPLDDWTVFRLTDDALTTFAEDWRAR